MLSLGFLGTVASVIVGAVVATVTVVGVVNNTVQSSPDSPGNVSPSQVVYGSR